MNGRDVGELVVLGCGGCVLGMFHLAVMALPILAVVALLKWILT